MLIADTFGDGINIEKGEFSSSVPTERSSWSKMSGYYAL
jgi:hypothetical protein